MIIRDLSQSNISSSLYRFISKQSASSYFSVSDINSVKLDLTKVVGSFYQFTADFICVILGIILLHHAHDDKKLSYRRGTARRAMSVEILSTAA